MCAEKREELRERAVCNERDVEFHKSDQEQEQESIHTRQRDGGVSARRHGPQCGGSRTAEKRELLVVARASGLSAYVSMGRCKKSLNRLFIAL